VDCPLLASRRDAESKTTTGCLGMFIHKYDKCQKKKLNFDVYVDVGGWFLCNVLNTEYSWRVHMGLHKSDVLVIEQCMVLLLACLITIHCLLFLKCPRLNPPSPLPRPL